MSERGVRITITRADAIAACVTTEGERGEYVWIEVRDWRDGMLDGEVVTPAPRIGLSRNQSVAIQQSQIAGVRSRTFPLASRP